jgi:hypothetical protein
VTAEPFTSSVEKEKDYLQNTHSIINLDGTERIFVGYEKTVKTVSSIRQAITKINIAQTVMEQELEHEEQQISQVYSLLGCRAVALMMGAVRTSEASVSINLATRRYIPEDSKLHTRRGENLKSYKRRLNRECHYQQTRR